MTEEQGTEKPYWCDKPRSRIGIFSEGWFEYSVTNAFLRGDYLTQPFSDDVLMLDGVLPPSGR